MRKIKSLITLVAALCVAVSTLIGLLAVTSSNQAAAAGDTFSITTSPGLDPAFKPTILDYAIRCTSSPTSQVMTSGPGPTTIGGVTFPGGTSLNVPLVSGQALPITHGGTTYYVRCLPRDFPDYSASVTGRPQQPNGYLLDLNEYSVIFDTDGVPVWWHSGVSAPLGNQPNFSEFLNPSTIAASQSNGSFQLIDLDGKTVGSIGGGSVILDSHDLELLPNGNYLGFVRQTRDVDLSSWGLSSTSPIDDNVIVEVTPSNQIVWSWSVADHIDVATADINWRSTYPDLIHMNSVHYDGNGGVIFSARNLDAVYRIDMATGAITWKLGGSATAQSLTVIGNTYSQVFSAQHDAKIAPDGSLTVYDDATLGGGLPRAVRFVIDTTANTATVVEQVTDPSANFSFCCGSAQKLATGNWVISWGGTDFMSELSPSGAPQLTITFPGQYSYRASPVPVAVASLRQGMDAAVRPVALTAMQDHWLVAADGGVFSYGDAAFYGSTGGMHLNQPIVGMAATPDGKGYWLVASDGGVFSYGDAAFHGSTGAMHLNKPVVGMAATPDGKGYWLVASDGGLFSYGDAGFYGSAGNLPLQKPVVGMVPTPDGQGYWLVASDGGVFSYGDAGFFGSPGNIQLHEPVVGIASTSDGQGYWLVAADGGVFSYGDAGYFGSAGGNQLPQPMVGISSTADGRGYWLVAANGEVFSYGDAKSFRPAGGLQLNQPVVGTASISSVT
jgi:Arylsulfotransferase (ASST)